TDVEITIRIRIAKHARAGSARHGRRDDYEIVVRGAQLDQAFAEHVRVCRQAAALLGHFALDLVEGRGAVPHNRILFRDRITFSFLGHDVNQAWAVPLLDLAQSRYQALYIMTIE